MHERKYEGDEGRKPRTVEMNASLEWMCQDEGIKRELLSAGLFLSGN